MPIVPSRGCRYRILHNLCSISDRRYASLAMSLPLRGFLLILWSVLSKPKLGAVNAQRDTPNLTGLLENNIAKL